MNEQQPNNSKALTPIDRMKTALSIPSVQQQFQNALAENAPLFVASLIDVYGSDSKLQQCEPSLVIMEALKAATLDLPINRQLGFAYIIPYQKSVPPANKGDGWTKIYIPQFQPGYKAFIQLAMRTGQYRYINADMVYEGEAVTKNRITGELSITGEAKSETVTGYFAYFQTVNGFEKAVHWSREKILSHAQRYSKSWNIKDKCFIKGSGWDTSFDDMALKTVLKHILSKYGILSVKMTKALMSDTDDEAQVQAEIDENANGDIIDLKAEVIGSGQLEEAPHSPPNGSANGTEQQQVECPY